MPRSPAICCSSARTMPFRLPARRRLLGGAVGAAGRAGRGWSRLKLRASVMVSLTHVPSWSGKGCIRACATDCALEQAGSDGPEFSGESSNEQGPRRECRFHRETNPRKESDSVRGGHGAPALRHRVHGKANTAWSRPSRPRARPADCCAAVGQASQGAAQPSAVAPPATLSELGLPAPAAPASSTCSTVVRPSQGEHRGPGTGDHRRHPGGAQLPDAGRGARHGRRAVLLVQPVLGGRRAAGRGRAVSA